MVVRLPTTKHLASNPLQAKALNDKSPTIVTPIITVRPDGAGEQAHSAPPDEVALWSPSLAGSFEGIASAKPPLVKENTIRLPKSKSLIHQGALATARDTRKIEDKPESSKGPQLVANAYHDEGRLDKGGTPNEMRVPSTTVTGSKEPGEGDHYSTVRSKGNHCSAVPAQPVAPLQGDAFEERTSHSTTDQKATGKEAASTQAVKRGHQVAFIEEVPDDKDITSFMMNKSAKLTPVETAVTLPTVVEPSWDNVKVKEAPQLSCTYTSVARLIMNGLNHSEQSGLCTV